MRMRVCYLDCHEADMTVLQTGLNWHDIKETQIINVVPKNTFTSSITYNRWAISPVNDKYCCRVQYYSLSKTSLRVRHQIRTFSTLLCYHQEVTRSYFQHTMRTTITTPKISFNTQDISSIRLPTQGMTYPRRCFGQRIASSFRACVI
jgi:hypothetical protein